VDDVEHRRSSAPDRSAGPRAGPRRRLRWTPPERGDGTDARQSRRRCQPARGGTRARRPARGGPV